MALARFIEEEITIQVVEAYVGNLPMILFPDTKVVNELIDIRRCALLR